MDGCRGDIFARTRLLLSKDQFVRLQNSRVTVVGLGAVGGYAVEGLARAGVQHLKIVDFDRVEASNINRQIVALHSTLGELKTEAMRERILLINPDCQVQACEVFVREDKLDRVLHPAPDLLIDAIDALNPKVQLLHAAYHRGIPTLSSMGAALRRDPFCIQSGDIFDTSGCPLARQIRKRLRRRGVGRGISCVYSTEQVECIPSLSEDGSQTAIGGQGRPRNTLGSLPTITGIFGLILANMAIMRLGQS